MLKEEGIYSKKLVSKCLSVYRLHIPDITLSNISVTVLKRLTEKYRNMYLVTDGNLTFQRNKISSLQLNKYFHKCMPTYQYGRKHSKPSLYCFGLIKSWEGVDYSNLVYIGDNPHKDFVSLNAVGAMTIRINTGMFKDVRLDAAHEATYFIDSLEEVLDYIKNQPSWTNTFISTANILLSNF